MSADLVAFAGILVAVLVPFAGVIWRGLSAVRSEVQRMRIDLAKYEDHGPRLASAETTLSDLRERLVRLETQQESK